MVMRLREHRVLIMAFGALALAFLGVIVAIIVSRDSKTERSIVLSYEIDMRKLSGPEISEVAEKYILPTLRGPVSEDEEQVYLSWQHIHQGIEVVARGEAQAIKLVKEADRLVRLQLPAFVRVVELAQRQESTRKMQKLLRMLRQYEEDGNDILPDSLDELRKYDAENVLAWILENIEYVGRGKSFATMQGPLAYDKNILAKGNGTNVLFAAGIVNFIKPEKLEKLGIIPKE